MQIELCCQFVFLTKTVFLTDICILNVPSILNLVVLSTLLTLCYGHKPSTLTINVHKVSFCQKLCPNINSEGLNSKPGCGQWGKRVHRPRILVRILQCRWRILATEGVLVTDFALFGVICRESLDINETIFQNSHQTDSWVNSFQFFHHNRDVSFFFGLFGSNGS